MPLSDQATDPRSTLCAFLNAHLPRRDVVVEGWIERLPSAPGSVLDVDAGRAWLGTALELRLGLDLADAPTHWGVLSFLPAERCRALLTAAGFAPEDLDHLPADGTSDPLLLSWRRVTRPTHCEDPAQRAALAACVDAAGIEKVAHRLHAAPAAQVRRSLFLAFRDAGSRDTDEDHPVFQGLLHMWRDHLRHGRAELRRLGERVIVAPPLAPGFATADLSIGRTLVEVKAAAEPDRHLHTWLNQLLGYLLLDRLDNFRWDTVAVHLGWHATTMSAPVADLLASATAGPTPALGDLRAEFHQAIGKELDDAARWHFHDRYPIPATAGHP